MPHGLEGWRGHGKGLGHEAATGGRDVASGHGHAQQAADYGGSQSRPADGRARTAAAAARAHSPARPSIVSGNG